MRIRHDPHCIRRYRARSAGDHVHCDLVAGRAAWGDVGGDPIVNPEERKLYDRLAKLQGTLFKIIGNIESVKIALASGAKI